MYVETGRKIGNVVKPLEHNCKTLQLAAMDSARELISLRKFLVGQLSPRPLHFISSHFPNI